MNSELLDAMNTYYSLKSQYENNFKKEKAKIIGTSELSWREKQREYQKLKQKCINCKRPVGTIFRRQFIEDKDSIHLIALCGDRKNPCPLNIDLNVGFTIDMVDAMHNDEKEISKYKKKIIKEKNNLLFGYTNTENAVKIFDEIKEQISLVMQHYEYILQIYMDIINNKEKEEDLKRGQAKFFLVRDNYKKLLENFERTQDTQFVLEAVELYKNEIMPLVAKIQRDTYAYSAVEYNEDDDTYLLVQKPITIEQLEFDLSLKPPGIVFMRMGTEKMPTKEKRVRELVPAAIPAISKKKTIKPKIKLVTEKPNEVGGAHLDNDQDNDANNGIKNGSGTDNDSDSDSDSDSELESRKEITIDQLPLSSDSDTKSVITFSDALKKDFIMEIKDGGNIIAKDPTNQQTYLVKR